MDNKTNSVTTLRNLLHAWALMTLPVDTDLSLLTFECISPSVHMPRLRKIIFRVGDYKIFACETEQLENPLLGKYFVTFLFKRLDKKQMNIESIRSELSGNTNWEARG